MTLSVSRHVSPLNPHLFSSPDFFLVWGFLKGPVMLSRAGGPKRWAKFPGRRSELRASSTKVPAPDGYSC